LVYSRILFHRLVKSKGVDILIKAFAEIVNEVPQVDLFIAGIGPEEEKLKVLVRDLGLSGRISFLGDISLSESVGFLKSAFCTVVPSRSEGGSLVNVEALSVGCPVIASNAGGIPEYVGPGGLIFDNGDKEQLRNCILKLWNEPELRDRLKTKGKIFATNFYWDKLFPKYFALYKRPKKGLRGKAGEDFPVYTKKIINWLEKIKND